MSDYSGKLDCRSCDETLRKERGHDEKGVIGFHVGRERVFRCPLTLISHISYEYIKAYSLYEKGFLPNGRGWMEESHKYIQAMMVVDNEFLKIEKEKCRKQT